MRRIWCLVAAALVGATLVAVVPAASAASATQFTWFDQTASHSATKYAELTDLGPTDWVSPTNFAGGRVYLRMEVLSKASTKPLDAQVCAWRNTWTEETCSKTGRFAETGVHWFDLGTPSAWWKKNGVWSWTTAVERLRLMVKDPDTGRLLMTGACGASCSTPEAVNGHIPITFDLEAIVVAAGASLAPPVSWQGCPTTWSPQCPNPASPSDWDHPTHRYRMPVIVSLGTTPRTDRVVAVPMDFGAALESGETFDPATLRITPAVPIQFSPSPGQDAAGDLLVLFEGTKTGTHEFEVYFDTVGSGIPAAPTPPRVTVTEGVVDEGQESIRFTTPKGHLDLHRQGGGFASLVDTAGNDWLAYSTAPGSAGAYRGLPNAVHPEGHFHPGSTTSNTELLAAGPLRATAVSTTTDGLWQMRYDIDPTSVRLVTMTRANGAYWFLYEGTPGGQIDPTTDVVIRSTNQRTNLSQKWAADLPADEWVAFADTVRKRSLFLAHHQSDTLTDSHWLMQGNMTVFGFGRSGLSKYLTNTNSMTVGLLDTDTTAAAKAASLDAIRSIGVTVGSTQPRPAGV